MRVLIAYLSSALHYMQHPGRTPDWVRNSIKRKASYYDDAFSPDTRGSRQRQPAIRPGVSQQTTPDQRVPAAKVTDEAVMTFLSAARAPSTQRQYCSVKRAYEKFVSANTEDGISAFPIDPFMLVRYAAHLTTAISFKGRPYAGCTIRNYIGILLTMNKSHPRARPFTVAEGELVRLAKQAVDRIKGKSTPNRARTLTAAQVRAASFLVPRFGRTLSTAALIIGVCALLRIREASKLLVGDIEIGDLRARICIRESKTTTSPQWVTLGCACLNHGAADLWCPYHRPKSIVSGRTNTNDKLFRATYKQLSDDVEELLSMVSDPDEDSKCTTHSMRRTGVALMKSSGMDSVLVAEHGRWMSTRMVDDVYARQATGLREMQAGIAKRMLL